MEPKMAKRAMKLKILYTFDDSHSTTCLARSSSSFNVSVAYTDDSNPLGVIELSACLTAVQRSSPELVAHDAVDYAVYSTDFTEPDAPLVGHGRMSWLMFLSRAPSSCEPPVQVVGRVCNNILPFAVTKETLQVNLRLTPIKGNFQRDYLATLQLYTVIAPQLPKDFNHPAWSQFVTRTNLIKVLASVEEAKIQEKHQLLSQHPSPVDDVRPPSPKRVKSVSTSYPSSSSSSASSDPVTMSSSKIQYPASSPPTQPMKFDEPISVIGSSRNFESAKDPKSSQNDHSVVSVADVDAPPMLVSDQQRPSTTNVFKNSVTGGSTYQSSTYQKRVGSNITSQAKQQKPKQARKKQKERIAESLMEAVANGDVPAYCQNCGDIKTVTWRILKHNDKTYRLCNACGLYLSAKNKMRPSALWKNSNGPPAIAKLTGTALPLPITSSNSKSSKPASASTTSTFLKTTSAGTSPLNTTSVATTTTSTTPKIPLSTSITDANRPVDSNQVEHNKQSRSASMSLPCINSINQLSSGVESEPLAVVARKSQSEQPVVSSSPPKQNTVDLSSPVKPSTQSSSSSSSEEEPMTNDDSNKENQPPPQLSTAPTFTQSPASELDSLFSTPVKRSSKLHSELSLTNSSSAVKWLKSIGKPPEEEDIFHNFLTSPSRKGGMGANSDFYDTLVSDLHFGSIDDSIPSETTAVPSSPPSFFYLYDEPDHWNKWSNGPDTVRSETVGDDQIVEEQRHV